MAVFLSVGAAALATGCGSPNEAASGAAGGGAATGGSSGMGGSSSKGGDPNCITGDGFLCAADLTGFPFVAFAASYSDKGGVFSGRTPPAGETTVTMSHPEPGKLCLSGRVAPAEFLAGMNLDFAPRNLDATMVLKPFDAAKLHITQASLTIDTPPSTGVRLSLFTVKQLECPNSPLDCNYGFQFGALGAGPVIVPFADFTSNDPSVAVDMTMLDSLVFQVGPGDYAFCIHDFKLLDANGVEVKDVKP
jgi:hypothetical protein